MYWGVTHIIISVSPLFVNAHDSQNLQKRLFLFGKFSQCSFVHNRQKQVAGLDFEESFELFPGDLFFFQKKFSAGMKHGNMLGYDLFGS